MKPMLSDFIPKRITYGSQPLAAIPTRELEDLIKNLEDALLHETVPTELMMLVIQWMQKIKTELESRYTSTVNVSQASYQQAKQNHTTITNGAIRNIVQQKPRTVFNVIDHNSNLAPARGAKSVLTRGTLGGSTSTTTSSRAHGAARFTGGNDPRMAHRLW